MSEELLLAVKQRQIAEVEALLEGDVNVNYKNDDGLTALHQATLNLDTAMMALLFTRHDILVDLSDENGHVALHHLYLEYQENDEVPLLPALSLLLQHNADLNQPDHTGETFMQWAAFNGYCTVVTRLLNAGADAKGALESAIEGDEYDENNGEMIQLLMSRLNLEGNSESSEYDEEFNNARNFN